MSASMPHLGRGARFAVGAVTALLVSAILLAWRPLDSWSDLEPFPEQAHNTWSLLSLGLLALIPWLLRLAQWRRAGGVQPAPAKLRAHITDQNRSSIGPWSPLHPFSIHIAITGADGKTWYQRVMFEPWLVTWGRAVRTGQVRRVGLWRRLYVIEVAGKGTLWPVTGATASQPLLRQLEPMPRHFPRRRHLSSIIAAALGLAFLAFAAAAYTNTLWGAPYAAATLVAVWCWAGSGPPGLRAPESR